MEAKASLEVSAANSGAMVANVGAWVAHRRQLRGCQARDCSYHRAFGY